MTKEEIKNLIKDLEGEIKQQREVQKLWKTKEGYGTYCQIEGEIFAKQTIINTLRTYL